MITRPSPSDWTPRPSRVVAGALAVLGLLILGVFVDFIPAAGLYGERAAIVFVVIGLCLTVLIYGALIIRTPFLAALLQAGWMAWLGVLLTPLILGLLAWLLLVKVGPWAITRAFGMDHQERVTMRTEHRYSRNSCDHLLRGGPFEATTRDYLCVSEGYYLRFPDQAVIVDLKGKASRLGFAVTSIHHVSINDDSNAD